MNELNNVISILMDLLFRPADRAEIDKTIKETIHLLGKVKSTWQNDAISYKELMRDATRCS